MASKTKFVATEWSIPPWRRCAYLYSFEVAYTRYFRYAVYLKNPTSPTPSTLSRVHRDVGVLILMPKLRNIFHKTINGPWYISQTLTAILDFRHVCQAWPMVIFEGKSMVLLAISIKKTSLICNFIGVQNKNDSTLCNSTLFLLPTQLRAENWPSII